jgi:hypothetical protein
MSLQDKIAKNFYNWKKRIHDYKVQESGTDNEVIRIKVTENIYGDENEWEIVSYDRITVTFTIPSDIPLTRLREDVTDAVADTENIFLYDILPIVGAARFSDNVEKGDFLICKIYGDNPNETQYYLVLRVSELMGNISHKHLLKKTFNLAPYSGSLPQEVQDIIDSYVEET